MRPWIIEGGIVAVSFGAWFGLYALLLVATRPRAVNPTPAAQDLGPEPPAIASLLGNGWDLTEDAIEGTLLDLGGRRILEFRQPANDPHHTTIHIVQTSPTGLTPYERKVFDRVSGLAVGGVVPLTALTFRDEKKAKAWWKRLRSDIVADARAKGLSRRRFSPAVLSALTVGALIATGGVIAAVIHYAQRQPPSTNDDDDPLGFIVPAAIFTFFGLMAFAGRDIGERDTPAGRETAARWLGVKAWLRGHEAFGDLPPAAVSTWDRYLGYGAALGVTRVASAVIDLGMGSRSRVWSSFGGAWHRIRVSYPRLWWRYGRPVSSLVWRAVIALVAGYALVRWWRTGVSEVAALDLAEPGRRFAGLVQNVGSLIGVVLLAYGAYVLVRVIIDAVVPLTTTGQVLWKQVWRSSSGGEDSPPVPWLYYLAIDNGRSDRTRAWALPAASAGRCDTGDTVTVTIRRWSRVVTSLKVDEHAAYHDTAIEEAPSPPASALRSFIGAAPAGTGPLLTAEEVGQALSLPVVHEDLTTGGQLGMTTFRTADRKRVVLMMQVVGGTIGSMAWQMNSRGDQLPGVGDGAWISGNRAIARSGDTIVLLTLMKEAKGRVQGLPGLLAQAVSRIPSQRTPAP